MAAEAPPAEPSLSQAQTEQVELARAAIFHLSKGIKNIGMYRHQDSKFPEYLAKAHEAIAQYGEKHGALTVRVDVTNLNLHGQALFNDDTPLPYKFFKDGIRQLIFREGFTLEELVTFTLIALTDPDKGGDDLNAQLWRAQLPHFEFIMAEGFKMDELGDGQVQVEVDRVVSYLAGRLRTDSEDSLRSARVSEDDLNHNLDGIEQMRGLVVAGAPADVALKVRVQKEINDEENVRLLPKLVAAVFQVVESGVDDASLLEEMFVQLLDAMLLQEDFNTITQMMLKLRAMEARQGPKSAIATLLKSFITKMGEEQRLMRVGDILKKQKPKHPQDITRYLSALGVEATLPLLAVLEQVEVPESRGLLLELLAPLAKQLPQPFVNRLESDRPQTVRDMLAVLESSGHPDRLKFLAVALKSQNVAIRLEALAIIGKARTGEVLRLVLQALTDDPSQQVRLAAARRLPELDRERAYLEIQRLVKDSGFGKRSPEEREALLGAMAATGLPGALAWFQGVLALKPGLFNKSKVADEKLQAVAGLIAGANLQTYKQLQEIAEDKGQPAEVQSAARVGLVKVKRVLFGNQEGGA